MFSGEWECSDKIYLIFLNFFCIAIEEPADSFDHYEYDHPVPTFPPCKHGYDYDSSYPYAPAPYPCNPRPTLYPTDDWLNQQPSTTERTFSYQALPRLQEEEVDSLGAPLPLPSYNPFNRPTIREFAPGLSPYNTFAKPTIPDLESYYRSRLYNWS